MRSRILAVTLAIVAIAAVIAVFTLVLIGRGDSPVEAQAGEIQWPAALSTLTDLPAQVADLTVDEEGAVWFPVLTPPDETGVQVNTLYRYDPTTESLETFALPDDAGSTFVARIEVGSGARAGKILVAWATTLLEIDAADGQVSRLSVPADPAKFEALPGMPRIMPIFDIIVDSDGIIWLSRANYPYLVAVYPDGSFQEFALPEEAGAPGRLAVDAQGRIWTTLIRHSQIEGANTGRFTRRFDPGPERSQVFPWMAGNIAGRGGEVVAIGGADNPATVRRLDTTASSPVALTSFGQLTGPGDEVAVGLSGDVWYHTAFLPGLVRLADNGSLTSFPLPTYTVDNSNAFGSGTCFVRKGIDTPDIATSGCEDTEETFTTHTDVLAIAVAPDGSAWFTTGGRIGHAGPD